MCQTPYRAQEVRNVFIGNCEGEDPRPKNFAQDVVNERRRKQREAQMGFGNQAPFFGQIRNGGIQIQIGGGPGIMGLLGAIGGPMVQQMMQRQRAQRLNEEEMDPEQRKKAKRARALANLVIVLVILTFVVAQVWQFVQMVREANRPPEEQGRRRTVIRSPFFFYW